MQKTKEGNNHRMMERNQVPNSLLLEESLVCDGSSEKNLAANAMMAPWALSSCFGLQHPFYIFELKNLK